MATVYKKVSSGSEKPRQGRVWIEPYGTWGRVIVAAPNGACDVHHRSGPTWSPAPKKNQNGGRQSQDAEQMLVCWITSFCTCARHGSLCAREEADGVSASRDLACWGREWQKNSFPP